MFLVIYKEAQIFLHDLSFICLYDLSLCLIGGQFKKSGTWDPMYKVKAKIGWSFHSRELFISERNCTTVVQKLSALSIIYLWDASFSINQLLNNFRLTSNQRSPWLHQVCDGHLQLWGHNETNEAKEDQRHAHDQAQGGGGDWDEGREYSGTLWEYHS